MVKDTLIKWKPLGLSIAIILAIYIILNTANQGGLSALIGFLLGGITVGFLIDGKITNISLHGVILGLVAGLISIIILLVQLFNTSLVAGIDIYGLTLSVLILLIYDVIAALVGSILGNLIRVEYKNSVNETSS